MIHQENFSIGFAKLKDLLDSTRSNIFLRSSQYYKEKIIASKKNILLN